MSLEQIYFIGQTIAAISIVASLVFVGFQVKATSRAVRNATAQAVNDNYAQWYLSLSANDAALATSLKAAKIFDDLSDLERAQFSTLMMALLCHTQNAFYQWKSGSLSTDLWRGWETILTNLVNQEAGKGLWKERHYLFGDDFQTLVQEAMSTSTHTDATVFGIVPIKNSTTVKSESSIN